MIVQVAGLLTLLLFYGCYITKVLKQRRQGVQTNQMGKGKTGPARIIELTMEGGRLSGLCHSGGKHSSEHQRLVHARKGGRCGRSGGGYGPVHRLGGDHAGQLEGGRLDERADRAGNRRYLPIQPESGLFRV